MKTPFYTLTINKPQGDILPRIQNCPRFQAIPGTSQFVIWDGPARPSDIMRLWEMVSPYCTGALLVRGKGEVQKHVRSIGSF